MNLKIFFLFNQNFIWKKPKLYANEQKYGESEKSLELYENIFF